MRGAALALALVAVAVEAAGQPLPPATLRLPATAEECAVWHRELSFALSVERHDAEAFASHLHPGAVFNAGTADAARGRDAVVAGWREIVAGTAIALRWRPGIVQIGGEPGVAVSRGPFILQQPLAGEAIYRVGFYQTVWVRDGPAGAWRVLFDAGASTPLPVADRAAAEAWVRTQPMSDCAGPQAAAVRPG